MKGWSAARTAGLGGYFRIIATRADGRAVDITSVRGVPTDLPNYTSADPFGDTTAHLEFPGLTPFDDFTTDELSWLHEDTLVDIWYVPGMVAPDSWVVSDVDTQLYVNPLTNQLDAIAPFWDYSHTGGTWTRQHTHRGRKVWEGQMTSPSFSDSTVGVDCQGALFQVDLMLAKPYFPPRPQPLETLIAECFSPTRYPSLRTQRLVIDWPDDWALVAPAFTGSSTALDPNIKPGAKWTGYTSRQTGSWDHTLTSYIQNMLATMLVRPGSRAVPGGQWTLRLVHEGDADHPSGRTPMLTVRSPEQAPSFSVWVGTPGLKFNLNHDATQEENAIYGTGTDIAGTTWRNAVVSSGGSRTDYIPLASDPSVYPTAENRRLRKSRFVREAYVQFGTGFSQPDAETTAEQMLGRNLNAGYAGSVSLSSDPSVDLSRWQITAGMTFVLKGFLGTGEQGIRLHVAQVEANPKTGEVNLTVDTRYRDLITLNESIARTRDALTPAKLLQLNRNSVTIEDIQAPWDYSAGSGYVPRKSTALYRGKPTTTLFPYSSWVKAHPPRLHGDWYIPIPAGASLSKKRWTQKPFQILMGEKGTIRRSEFFVCDRNGNILPIAFHVSLYYNNGINPSFMPHAANVWSPFITGAFQSIDPGTGQPWTTVGHEPDKSMVIGWGNKEQPAGYSPGLKSAGTRATGLLVDEGSWTWDCSSNNPNYDHLAKAGKEAKSVISLYLMAYAEYFTTVYLGGRLYREEPGTT